MTPPHHRQVVRLTLDDGAAADARSLCRAPRNRGVYVKRALPLDKHYDHHYNDLIPGSMYVKIDDDIVYIGERAIEQLVGDQRARLLGAAADQPASQAPGRPAPGQPHQASRQAPQAHFTAQSVPREGDAVPRALIPKGRTGCRRCARSSSTGASCL
jgi:hypothetical protein